MCKATLTIVLFLLVSHVTRSQESIADLPEEVQRFGPLVFVAGHDEVPNPDDTAQAMLSNDPIRKLSALQSMGVGRHPFIRQLWTDLQKSEANATPEQLAALWVDGSVPWDIYDQENQKYQFLEFALSKQGDEIFTIEAVIRKEGGKFVQIATIACRCSAGNGLAGKHADWRGRGEKIFELVNGARIRNEQGWEEQAVRFRIIGGRLQAVLTAEHNSWTCPDNDVTHRPCKGSGIYFDYALLVDEKGRPHPGATLSEMIWTEGRHDMEASLGKSLSCTPVLWNEASQAYEAVDWKARNCGKLPRVSSLQLVEPISNSKGPKQ